MTGGFYVVAAARKPDSYLTLFNLKGKLIWLSRTQGSMKTFEVSKITADKVISLGALEFYRLTQLV